MPFKKPFDQFTPTRWRGTAYPADCMREGIPQVVALSFDTPTGVLHLLLDEATAEETAHACLYWRTAQSLRSSEIPNSEVAPSEGQSQEPPANASTATSAET